MYINCEIRSSTGIARIYTLQEYGPRRINVSMLRVTPFIIERANAGDSINIQAVVWGSLSIFQKKDVVY